MLTLDDIRVSLAGHTVLRGVSFTLPQGATTVLVGRNGAGKTTTLRTIMGLVPLGGGRLTLDGTDLAAQPDHARAGLGIGYAPEDRRMIPAFSVEDNLLLPAVALKMPAGLSAERLAMVYELMPELTELKNRPGGSLSGGQGKMVALGRALMIGTRLVLLDEPFQGLAPVLAQRYGEALRALQAQDPGLSLLITESNPALLEGFANRTIGIERGEIEPAPAPAATGR